MTQTKLSIESQDVVNAITEAKSELEQIDNWLTKEVDSTVNSFIDKWQQVCQPEQSMPAKQFVEDAQQILKEVEPFQEQVLEKAQGFATMARNRLSVVGAIAIKEPEVKNAYNEILSWWNDTQQPRIEMYLKKCCEIEEDIHQMIEFAMASSNNSDKEE